MKRLVVTLALLAAALPSYAARQSVTQITGTQASIGALKTQINTRLDAADDNFIELYGADAAKADVSCFATAAAFDACFDLSWVNPAFTSVHATGGNIAANNMQVTKAWLTGLSYTANETSVIHGGQHYICTSNHTAGASTEPGVGASWETVWSLSSGAGDDLGSATYSNVVALWASGSCSGYMKSDGSCDTPSGSATYPGSAGVANWNGSAWGTSYTVGTGASNLVQLNASSQLPAVSAALLTNFPTLNQNTTGSAATLTTARTIGGTSFNGSANIDISYANLTNKPTLGTSAQYDVGTSIGNIVRLVDSGGNPALPFTLNLFDINDGAGTSLDVPASSGSWMTFAATTGAMTYLTPGTGVATFLATPSSANLASAVTNETGSASGTPLLVFNQSPRIDNIELGAANDTTLSRSAAGVMAVEGVNVLMGSLGSTDNQLVRTDGTGGATAQGTGVTVDDSNNITVPGNISSNGSITGLMPSRVISSPSGTHDGSSNVATLSDSGESFTTNAYVGMTLYNITDGSSCTITANNATTMTCTLTGGTDNDWDASDVWQVGPGPYQSGSWFYVTNAGTIRHPSTAGYQVCYESDAAAVLTIDMASGSMIFQGVLDSAVTALDAGDSIDSSGSTTGDFQCIHNKSATEAQGKGKRGTWVDGGAT